MIALFLLISLAVAVQTSKSSELATIEAMRATPQSSTYCVDCLDLAIDLLDGALEDILRGDVFLGCVDFCNSINSNQYCIALCVIIGETVLNEGLDLADIDPPYICELAKLCPMSNCPPSSRCGSLLTLTATYRKSYNDFLFNVTLSSQGNYTWPGMVCIEVVQGSKFNDPLLEYDASGVLAPWKGSKLLQYDYVCPQMQMPGSATLTAFVMFTEGIVRFLFCKRRGMCLFRINFQNTHDISLRSGFFIGFFTLFCRWLFTIRCIERHGNTHFGTEVGVV
jgi:hypothetical protein